MNAFRNIPIHVERPAPPDDSVIARSVLRDIQMLLEEFALSGRAGAIDLRQVPRMGPNGYQLLKETLSAGEVAATIHGVGRTEVHETAYPGIWWVTHRNQADEIVTELIEVTDIPEILKSQPEDIRHGLQRLAQRLAVARPDRPAMNLHSSGGRETP